MNEVPSESTPISNESGKWSPIRVGRLASKELRETLRDRRTIVTLFLMPLLVYPILSLMFQGFFVSNFQPGTDGRAEGQFLFVFESDEDLDKVSRLLDSSFKLMEYMEAEREKQFSDPSELEQEAEKSDTTDLDELHLFKTLKAESGLSLEDVVQLGEADVGVKVEGFERVGRGRETARFTFYYRTDSPRSVEAVKFIEQILSTRNISYLDQRLIRSGLRTGRVALFEEKVVKRPAPPPISFAAVIPLILTLMTITGAVYPAIDLTAGERERGTLESMIAAPIPRMRILLGKLVAVIAVAMLTAVLNMIGMTITIWVFRLDTVLFGEQGLTIVMVLQILGLLVLFAAFFGSVLLVITSFARSFKEGQAYLIPVMLIALAPGLLSLKPDLQLNGLWAVTPLVNIVLLSRDVLQGNVDWTMGLVTVVATIFYAALAITMAARFFGTAGVLYGDTQGIGSLFQRPKERTPFASASLAMLCLALLFPASFIWQGVLARTADQELALAEATDLPFEEVERQRLVLVKQQSALAAAGIIVVFFVVPFLITQFHRVRFFSGYRIRATSLFCMVAAVLLGIGLGPLLLQAIASSGQWIEVIQASGEDSQSTLLEHAEAQAAKLRMLPIWWVLVCFALVPAIFEELFFRGLLFQALRAALSPWKTILATAIMFGIFHLITTSGLGLSRLLPTTLMGIILGWVCYRSGSVLPGMVLHGIHNALTLTFSYYRDELVALNFIEADQQNVPLGILMGGLLLSVLGVVILSLRRKDAD